ncbi:cytidylyltransferase domain-containing protein [Chitinophaga sp. Ak27]|uniref:cytidylyltransferase domain-containing protein n=1 Tax=Chitinophaga sp. Ak27 TaxID=2726116 RepID=UPI00145C6AE0|nr:glycosyltransferase family protein [Chitinophaga sp. Ak27]NLU94398.1 LPS biosynthesis protein [Chitinophaga sp. Ak27]
MRIIAVTQARVGSSRLPGKVLREIDGITLLQIHLERILKSRRIDKLKVATTLESEAASICNIASALGLDSYCGSTDDVLDRYYQCVIDEHPDYVVRITSDCPLIDPQVIDEVIDFTVAHQLDYVSNTLLPTFPDGMDVEVFTMKALKQAWTEAALRSDREHVTPYIWRNSSFKGGALFVADNVSSGGDYGALRLTVDEQVDFDLIQLLIGQLGLNSSWKEYADYVKTHPEIQRMNQHIIHNEGYINSINKDIK